jgi:transcriptional regulator with XRE-family HTH domain
MPPRRVPEVDQRVGARIRVVRTRAGLTQERLAEGLGVETLSVSRFETGRRGVSIPTLFRIADALGVRVQDLLDVELPPQALELVIDSQPVRELVAVMARMPPSRQRLAVRLVRALDEHVDEAV